MAVMIWFGLLMVICAAADAQVMRFKDGGYDLVWVIDSDVRI